MPLCSKHGQVFGEGGYCQECASTPDVPVNDQPDGEQPPDSELTGTE